MQETGEKLNKILRGEKGITLVALVVTIIIIIVLATVAISFAIGENGLITKAEQAKLQQGIATSREELTMVLGDAFAEKQINPKYDNNDFLDKFIEQREPNVYLEDEAIGLNGYIFGLDRTVPELEEYQGTLEELRIQDINVTNQTTSSVTIEVITINAENEIYEYWYKNAMDADAKWIKHETDENSNTCTIEGLTQGNIYEIKVVVTTKEDSTEKIESVHIGEIPNGTITFTPVEWEGDGTAKTTISTSVEGYTLQYQIVEGNNLINDNAWQPATSGQEIGNLHHNETVFGRLFDGTNESKEYGSRTIKDEEAPDVIVTTNNVTTNGGILEVTASDGETGLAEANTYKYYVDEETEPRETSTNSSYNFTGLTQGKEHILKVVVTDKAGNTTEKTATITTTTLPGGEEAVTQGAITFTNLAWASGQASVTISTNTGNTIQYQVVANEETSVATNWLPVPEGGVIGNLNHRDVVYARLTDKTNYGDEASTTIKDEISPVAATIELSDITGTAEKTVTATVTHNDGESGPNITQCKYIWNKSNEKLGIDPSLYTEGTFSSNGETISKIISTPEIYYLHVLTVDKAGNKWETVSEAVDNTNEEPTGLTVNFSAKTTSSLTVTAKATDADGDNLKYTLYAGTATGNLDKMSNPVEVAQNQTATITLSGLNSYTDYIWRVDVTDGKDTIQGTEQKSIRTYCSGRTYSCTRRSCSNGYTSSRTCSYCDGTGKCPNATGIFKITGAGSSSKTTESGSCMNCGKTTKNTLKGNWTCNGCGDSIRAIYSNSHYFCSTSCVNSYYGSNATLTTGHLDHVTGDPCDNCGGDGRLTSYHYCSHGYTSSHYYCEKSNNCTSRHYWCEHGYTSQHD